MRTVRWAALAALALAACSDSGKQRGQQAQGPATGRTQTQGTDAQAGRGMGGGGEADAKAGQSAPKTVEGQVVRASKDELVLQEEGGQAQSLRLKVDDSTQVMVGGHKASAQDLKEGQTVRASFDPKENKAVRIETQTGGSAAPPQDTGGTSRTGGSSESKQR